MKQQLTITFSVTATGRKEKPIVIWKSKNPRCLRRFDKSLRPVTYFSQAKAWMTGDILESILSKLNRQMVSKNCKILLFMDNAGCHPEKLRTKFSNIQICFCLPTPPLFCNPWTWVSSIISRSTIGNYFCNTSSQT